MAKTYFDNPSEWNARTITGEGATSGSTIEDLVDTGENFPEFREYLDEYQKGKVDESESTRNLGVENLSSSINSIGHIGTSNCNELKFLPIEGYYNSVNGKFYQLYDGEEYSVEIIGRFGWKYSDLSTQKTYMWKYNSTTQTNAFEEVSTISQKKINRFSTDSEILEINKKLSEKTDYVDGTTPNIKQARTSTTTNFYSNAIRVSVDLLTFMRNQLGELRTSGNYTFIWNNSYQDWTYQGIQTTLGNWGITIYLNDGILVNGDNFTVTYSTWIDDNNNSVTQDYANLVSVNNISQLTNDGDPAYPGSKYIGYRDIIALSNLPIVIEPNTDDDYSDKYSKKCWIPLNSYLRPYEIEHITDYFPKIMFDETYAAYCGQVCFTALDKYQNPAVYYYTNNQNPNILIPSLTLTYSDLPKIPDTYVQVSYLKSTGVQWINTGVEDENGFVAEMLMNFASFDNGDSNNNTRFIGDVGTDGTNNVESSGLVAKNVSGKTEGTWGVGMGNIEYSNDVASLNKIYSVRVDSASGNGQIYAGGKRIFTSSSTFNVKTDTPEIYLYACNDNINDTPIGLGAFKIYRVKIYNSTCTELLADLYPCHRKTDLKPGFYDLVNEEFLTNANPDPTEEDFIIGYGGELLDYIISGEEDPTMSTKGNKGQFYFNTITKKFFVCFYNEIGIRTWKPSLLNITYGNS